MSPSKGSPTASGSDPPDEPPPTDIIPQEPSPAPEGILELIDSLKNQVASDRTVYIKKRMDENLARLADVTKSLHLSAMERRKLESNGADVSVDLLTRRQKDAIDMQNGLNTCSGDDDSSSSQEDSQSSSAILLGSSIAVKNAVNPIKLPEVTKLPPFTTWIFLDRNQRMTEDQSVVGRRRIYYDQNGGEALICSDSEEEVIEEDEEKKEFAESEDYILRMTIKEFGLSDAVLYPLAECLSRKPCEVKARYEVLIKEENTASTMNGNAEGTMNLYLDKNLEAALDSFDNLFCRRCYVFDCRLHGCSQDLIIPAERQLHWRSTDAEREPCGTNCYRLALNSESHVLASSPGQSNSEGKSVGADTEIIRKHIRQRSKSSQSGSASSNEKNISESSCSEGRPANDVTPADPSSTPLKSKVVGKAGNNKRNSKRIADHVLLGKVKRHKKMTDSDTDSVAKGSLGPKANNLSSNPSKENEDVSSSQKMKSPSAQRSRRKESPAGEPKNSLQVQAPGCQLTEVMSDRPPTSNYETLRQDDILEENMCKQEASGDRTWKPIEKALYDKGLEIFGRNSCLIARNLMNGLKTCWEVFQYMNHSENKLLPQGGDATFTEGCSKGDGNGTMGKEVRRRSRFLRRKGRVRRLKYSWKSAGYLMRKRISDKDQPARQYNPCGCKTACGKECQCVVNGTCCEKYCGCPKSCKNRFRGCHCAKSQCRSRQCPCFAANRECDPDVCRNCWISCGDGILGVPSQRGDNYECRNMKLLLKQQQRVLLGRSDISGWGAFLKNSVSKHEYLGEYTGELVSHREADKRGKIYDRENSSFLFNLNDQYVLDAYRKGDKLKFANHSPAPNCYAKVVMVAGDHRVGIFAKERICAGEELFYDYQYEADRAPAWARKPDAPGTKKDDAAPPSGRAKKHT